jgi:hypothetical protein
MTPLLTATRFLKIMGSGRTQPCLMAYGRESGITGGLSISDNKNWV